MTDLKFVQLSTPEDIAETHASNHQLWGPGLTLEEYHGREALFRSQNIHQKAPLRNWALRNGSDTVAAMETNYIPALIKIPGKPVEETGCYTIMSVYTPERFRGNGYATKMLTAAVDKLDELSADDKHFTMLWSDIGAYYSKFGFQMYDAHQIELKLGGDAAEWPGAAIPVTLQDLAPLAKQDEEALRQEMEKEKVPVAAPTPSVDTWLAGLNRCQYIGEKVTGKKHTVFGAKVNNSFIIWVPNWAKKGVDVMRLHLTNPADMDALFQALINDAQNCGLEKIMFWSQDYPSTAGPEQLRDQLAQQTGVTSSEITVRDSSQPMVRFSPAYKDTKWLRGGKYACW